MADKKQAAAYHGAENGKYALRGADGTPGETVEIFQYLKSVAYDPDVDTQEIYANDCKIMSIISDQGYTGSIGTTAQDRAFEEALGHLLTLDGMIADVNSNGFNRIDFYYEYKEETPNGTPYMVKVWILNLEVSKSSKENKTDEKSVSIGEYSYPITIYGDKVKSADGSAVYRDANGMEWIATRLIAVPGDTAYETFGDSVPVPKVINDSQE